MVESSRAEIEDTKNTKLFKRQAGLILFAHANSVFSIDNFIFFVSLVFFVVNIIL